LLPETELAWAIATAGSAKQTAIHIKTFFIFPPLANSIVLNFLHLFSCRDFVEWTAIKSFVANCQLILFARGDSF
jgi:hypothetical protein